MKALRILIALIFIGLNLQAQDTLTFKNGDVIVGELKSMDRGAVTIETDYSDKDFKIEWDGIQSIRASERYLITTSDGQRINGYIQTQGDGTLLLEDVDGKTLQVAPSQVVGLNSLDDGFLSRLYASIDVGYSLAKANNQNQVTVNGRMGYLADFWSVNIYYNSLLSRQDSVEDIRRNDGGVGYRYYLDRAWYLSSDFTYLQNTEQALDLRANTKIGVGRYFIHTNQSYWGVGIGAANNIEQFAESTGAEGNTSWEAYIGSELNLYDIGDLNLFANAVVYPSLTESGRIRSDIRFDAKYSDLFIDDFYIRAGITINYDNQPAVAGSEMDYIFTTGFGWSW